MNERTSSTSSATTGSQQNYETPIGELQNKLRTANLNDYVLIGKKGETFTVFSSGDQSESQEIIQKFAQQYEEV